MTDKSKQNQVYHKESRVKRKIRKSRLEIALGSVMDGFSTSNEKTEGKFVTSVTRNFGLVMSNEEIGQGDDFMKFSTLKEVLRN